MLKTKLNGKNKIMAVNTWAVATLRYSTGVVDWTVEELKELDRKTRKMMTLHGALHPKTGVDRLYLPRQNGGRRLISCEMCVKAEENNLAWYVNNSNERLMEGVRKTKILNSERAQEKNEFKQDRQNATLNRWAEKKMHGQFLREMPETVDKVKTWEWTRNGDLKVETEALIFAAQEQALRTNYIKFGINKSVESPLCRLCGQRVKQ